jgi:hypothetical protein
VLSCLLGRGLKQRTVPSPQAHRGHSHQSTRGFQANFRKQVSITGIRSQRGMKRRLAPATGFQRVTALF